MTNPLRILFVVQRYGQEVGGGAEAHCRWLAEGLLLLGHEVTVATSCALNYTTWENHFEAGASLVNGIEVVRFPVGEPRDVKLFNELSAKIDFYGGSTPLSEQSEWLLAQGPDVVGMKEWLEGSAADFDIAIIFTYLYRTAQLAIEALAGRLPIIMHATAHDEPPIYLEAIQRSLKQVTEFFCSTIEEADLLGSILSPRPHTTVVGIGVSLSRPSIPTALLARLNLARGRYAIILGRVDESKGVLEGIRHFREFRKRTASDLSLVVVGDNVAGLRSDELVRMTGFVADSDVSALILGAEVLIQPSYFESFSLALCEAWLAAIPTLVNEKCDTLAGQTRRSQGGLSYSSVDEFVQHLSELDRSSKLRLRLGRAGRGYVIQNFRPNDVLRKIESRLFSVAR